jgi:hypothetical protein
MQVVLFNDNAGPHAIEQLALGDDAVSMLDQRPQHVVGTGGNGGHPPVDQHLALVSSNFDPSEAHRDRQVFLTIGLSRRQATQDLKAARIENA